MNDECQYDWNEAPIIYNYSEITLPWKSLNSFVSESMKACWTLMINEGIWHVTKGSGSSVAFPIVTLCSPYSISQGPFSEVEFFRNSQIKRNYWILVTMFLLVESVALGNCHAFCSTNVPICKIETCLFFKKKYFSLYLYKSLCLSHYASRSHLSPSPLKK